MKQVTLNQTYRIDFSRREIRNISEGTEKSIEPRLLQILQLLIRHKGEVLTRKKIIENIWGNYGSGDELLTHSICLIRNTLDKSVIRTVPKRGYVLEAEVTVDKGLKLGFLKQLTFSRIAAALVILMILKMIFFPHH